MEYDKEGGTTIKKKVLIIDDDLNVCKEIKYALQNETTDVFYALSVQEGLKHLTKYHFCLVIMDILLSEIDGLKLLKLIHQIKPLPILVLSSKPGNEERSQGSTSCAAVLKEIIYLFEINTIKNLENLEVMRLSGFFVSKGFVEI